MKTDRASNLPPGDDQGPALPRNDTNFTGEGATAADMRRGYRRINPGETGYDRDEAYGPEPNTEGGFAGRPDGYKRI